MSFDFTRFTKRITLDAAVPLQNIYRAWTTQQGLESWFLRKAVFTNPNGKNRPVSEMVQKDDQYEWLWFGYDDDTEERGSVLDINGKDRFQFSFSGGCIVTISIKKESGETICELTQEMPMPEKDRQQYFYIECGKGWTFYLANLKSILEGGIDLRNKNIHIQRVINA